MQILGITALFFCISIFVSSINAKQNHLNSSKYEYVLKDINSSEELGIAVNYLTTNNIQYTYLSEEKTIWIGDYCLSLYVTDLNSLDDFYAFDYDKKNEHMALSNSILLPSALAKDENLKVGDIIRIKIDNLYYDMKIEGFFNEVISLMAFSSPINGLEYNSYHYMLLNGIIDNNMIDKIELETSGDVIQREEAFLNQELPNKILDISAILVMTVLTILIILLYLFFKASTYKNQAPNNLLNIVDINIIYKKRSILAINFASLAYTFVAFLVSLFFIIPFLNTLFNSFNYINYAALSIVNYLTIVFSIFAFYIIINFMEYFIYNPKKDAYEKK